MEALIKICTNEDIDLIEEIEDREEAQEQYENEIEKIYQYLKSEEKTYPTEIEVEQIDDYRFT